VKGTQDLAANALAALEKAIDAAGDGLPDLLGEIEKLRARGLLKRASMPTVKGAVLTPQEAAGRLGRSVDWIYRHRHSLPSVRLPGGRKGIPEAALEKWLRDRGGVAAAPCD